MFIQETIKMDIMRSELDKLINTETYKETLKQLLKYCTNELDKLRCAKKTIEFISCVRKELKSIANIEKITEDIKIVKLKYNQVDRTIESEKSVKFRDITFNVYYIGDKSKNIYDDCIAFHILYNDIDIHVEPSDLEYEILSKWDDYDVKITKIYNDCKCCDSMTKENFIIFIIAILTNLDDLEC